MLIATDWKEYQILDTGDGAKLEKWGSGEQSFVLSRPDPQVIWTKEFPELWDHADGVYTRNLTGGGSWTFSKPLPERWKIEYPSAIGELKFWIRPTDFKHMGIFPEQAVNWNWMIDKVKSYKVNKVPKVLNLFAYTGGATIACAKAGAEVTHVDSAKGMVEWASDNAKLNDVEARWIIDDVQKFVNREIKRGAKYDAIIMDPPSYGRGKTGETWKIEKMLLPLVTSCVELLSDEPLFFLINSYTTGLGATAIENVLKSALGDKGGNISSEEIALPVKDSDKVLPAGVAGRWLPQ